jgi:GNAT superfamily N-acetyltransferase
VTTVRTIRADEAEHFLDLMCKVFGLDPGRARGIFFAEPLFDLARKWALFQDGDMRAILTTTGLRFGWGRAIGIAGVCTDPAHQGKGLAGRLLEHVLADAEAVGEGPALLFAHRTELYARHGFTVLDEVVRGRVKSRGAPPSEPVPDDRVRAAYEAWAAADPDRLVRDPGRWRYWSWTLRLCEPFGDGYLCAEPQLLREAVPGKGAEAWPVPSGTEWYGLRSVTEALDVPVSSPRPELLLMGRGVTGRPQMFMTDQF